MIFLNQLEHVLVSISNEALIPKGRVCAKGPTLTSFCVQLIALNRWICLRIYAATS